MPVYFVCAPAAPQARRTGEPAPAARRPPRDTAPHPDRHAVPARGGLAHAARVSGGPPVALAFIGDGGTAAHRPGGVGRSPLAWGTPL
jgi:hypothetical protein